MENMNINLFRKKLFILYGDMMIIAASFYLAPFVRFKVFPDPLHFFGLAEVVAMFVYISVLYVLGFYNIEQRITNFISATQLLLAIVLINIFNSSLFYLLHLRPYGLWVLLSSSFFILIFLMIWRLVCQYIAGIMKNPMRIILFGAGNSGRMLYDLLKSKSDYQVIGFIDDDPVKNGLTIDGLPVLGGSHQLIDIVKGYAVHQVIVCVSNELRSDVYPKLVEAGFGGVVVYEMPIFYEKIAGKVPVLHNSHLWQGYADIYSVKKNIYNIKLKNVMDRLMAVAGFIVAAPLFIITAILVKMESEGPVIHAQRRVGLDEAVFVLYKFRSMCVDAEVNGAVWAEKNDLRITRVGKIIRLLRIDELPQFWNVLKGEMSFIGPRPERPEFVTQLETKIPHYMLRHCVKPGISGWAQVNYPYGDSLEDAREKLQYDLYYIKNQSFLFDLYIMLRTVRVVLFGTGAR